MPESVLPLEILKGSRRPSGKRHYAHSGRNQVDEVYEKMIREGESFWSAVRPLYDAQAITRQDMRMIIARGLEQTSGDYHGLLKLFNMPPKDYRPFLEFLRKHRH